MSDRDLIGEVEGKPAIVGTRRRYHIRDRWWTVAQIAAEAGLTVPAVYYRINQGVTGEALLAPPKPRAQTREEARIRDKLRRMTRRKYRVVCPGCGAAFDSFQPDHVLRVTIEDVRIKP